MWGQISDLTRTKIKSDTDFSKQDKHKGCVWLLKETKNVGNKIEDTKDPLLTIIESIIRLCNLKNLDEDLLECAEQLQAIRKANCDVYPDSGVSPRSALIKSIVKN